MFEKKDVIFSETLGVCVVHDITRLTDGRNVTIPYYVLKNYFHREKVSYIPVEDHQVVLRELIGEEDAKARYDEAVANDTVEQMDELDLQEIAYLLGVKPEELVMKDEEEV